MRSIPRAEPAPGGALPRHDWVDLLAILGLGPWLLVQGRRVRRETPVFPEPPGPRNGLAEPPLPQRSEAGVCEVLRVLITGDSAAAGVGASHQREALAGQLPPRLAQGLARPIAWDLVARTGLDIEGLCSLLVRHAGQQRYDLVMVSIGVNEVTAGTGWVAWQLRLRRLHHLLQTQLGARLVVYSGIPPMHRFPALPQPLRWFLGRRARRLDQALAQWTQTVAGAQWVALPVLPDSAIAADGFHPGLEAYPAWAEALVQAVLARRSAIA